MNLFSSKIQSWYIKSKRNLPWRNTKNPYKIWLSEIILQQTRVNQGLNYYISFVEEFPTIQDLANASEKKVFRLWQGLGYYSRVKNLHYTAKFIVNELNGVFPNKYSELIKLKGVGVYTASAISSFAFKENKAVVDGNVYRVLARYFNHFTDISSALGKKEFQEFANHLLDNKNPDIHNQALMELGSLICTPKQVKCNYCPVSDLCEGYRKKTVNELPIKVRKSKIVDLFFHYLVYKWNGKTYVQQRSEKGIWSKMYEFPLIESKSRLKYNRFEPTVNFISKKEMKIHKLSHRNVYATFWEIKGKPKGEFIEIKIEDIDELPKSILIDRYLNQSFLFN